MSKVIVVDDIKSYCEAVCERLRGMGIGAVGCYNVKKAKWLIEHASRNDVMLVDLVLKDESGWSGTDILRWMRRQGYHQMFFLMTGFGTMENSIETLELGAKSYIPKDQMDGKFYARIKDIMDEQNRIEMKENRAVFRRQSKAFQTVYKDIKDYAATGIRLVITGESGTGRQHLAEELMVMSGVEGNRYAHVDCTALSRMEHVEEYFFGHQKGAFASAVSPSDGILEKADESFLFLENVDRMPKDIQGMLIDVLENRRYRKIGSSRERFIRFSVVSTSCVSPDEAVASGIMLREFRDCICEGEVAVPPLRETKDDILPLANFFVEQFDPKKRKLSKEARKELESYHWPGNVRELMTTIKTAVARCYDDKIGIGHLNLSKGDTAGFSLAEAEKHSIIAALKRNGNNKTRAAAELGMSRKTIYNKISEYDIRLEDN